MRRPRARELAPALAACLCSWPLVAQQPVMTDPAVNPRRLRTPERLRIQRLRALHEDLVKLRQTRRPLEVAEGYTDLRAVIHAHSSISHDSKGSLEGLVKGAKAAGVNVIMTTEHPPKDRDALAIGLRGLHDGVLFIPGTEEQNLLTFPTTQKHDPALNRRQRIEAITREMLGLVFIAHPEEIEDWPALGERFTGMEIYNTHADLKDEPELQRMLTRDLDLEVMLKLWEAFRFQPAESFACLQDAPTETLKRWDQLTQMRNVVGIAANDSHENTRFEVRKKSDTEVEVYDFYNTRRSVIDVRLVPPIIPALRLLADQKVGDRLMVATLDPYERSFQYVNTHILAREQSEPAVRAALSAGHCYVSFDWIADPTGAFLRAVGSAETVLMGDSVNLAPNLSPNLALEFGVPIECAYRVIENGRVMLFGTGRFAHIPVTRKGVYRVEFWISAGGEDRPWLYTNPIYVR